MSSRSHPMVMVLLAGVVGACGGGKVSLSTADGLQVDAQGKEGQGGEAQAAGARSRCDASAPDRETSEYDTSGDGQPDVFKVFRRLGSEPLYRLVMSCREVDLNGDGIKDVVRHYDDEGRPQREEADRNFDGKPDEFTFYQHGEIMQRDVDTNADGMVDVKIYYDAGKPMRSERDLAGRSTADKWKPDRWEYYEESRVIRMGTDLDGDGRVDRWDRNESLKRTAAKQETEAEEEGEEATEPGSEPESESESKSESTAGG
jgi:hypothetical protein